MKIYTGKDWVRHQVWISLEILQSAVNSQFTSKWQALIVWGTLEFLCCVSRLSNSGVHLAKWDILLCVRGIYKLAVGSTTMHQRRSFREYLDLSSSNFFYVSKTKTPKLRTAHLSTLSWVFFWRGGGGGKEGGKTGQMRDEYNSIAYHIPCSNCVHQTLLPLPSPKIQSKTAFSHCIAIGTHWKKNHILILYNTLVELGRVALVTAFIHER